MSPENLTIADRILPWRYVACLKRHGYVPALTDGDLEALLNDARRQGHAAALAMAARKPWAADILTRARAE